MASPDSQASTNPKPLSPSHPVAAVPGKAFEIKGSVFSLLALCLKSDDPLAIDAELKRYLARSPGFFAHEPFAIDCAEVAESKLDLEALIQALRARELNPIGVCNAGPAQRKSAQALGLALLEGSGAGAKRKEPSGAAEEKPHEESVVSRTIAKPVRTGQRVYVRGDLTLLAAVNPGAEVLADGNIHVYAPLRGRALAGVNGDVNARIFAKAMDAELVAIAGCYRLLEENTALRGKPAQAFLDGDRLLIEPL